MADQITNCITFKNPDDNSIVKHLVYYQLEDGPNSTITAVIVDASEMTDPTDMDELKTKANVKATDYKATWLSQLASQPISAESTNLNCDVTL